uniref:Uncharacterized protein n=1 Tax=Phlebotomus papatasi TaxID=29031 RepID=A0A1B0CYZ7_PHLPP
MSWQDYVDNQLLASRCVSKAAIAGHDGGVWAKSDGFELAHVLNRPEGALGLLVATLCSQVILKYSPKVMCEVEK